MHLIIQFGKKLKFLIEPFYYHTISSSCAGSGLPIPDVYEPVGGHAFVRPGEHVFTFCKAECHRPL